MADPAVDPWARWRAATRARIGLGRSGDALPTKAMLDFELAHSRARDAVRGAVDFEALARRLDRPSILVRSQATDRLTFLRRPDLGRRLDPACDLPRGEHDIAFVLADGLSAKAVEAHALPLLQSCLARLEDWRIAPIVLAEQARVALGDEIGARLNAACVAVLIGERPGLSAADSLGVYLTWNPRPGRQDSERNCISNIHGGGLGCEAAARMLAWLLNEARRRKLSGVGLKLDVAALGGPAPDPT